MIEFSGLGISTSVYGEGTAANNILVRPPIGQRRTLGSVYLRGKHVTFAGFNGGSLRIGYPNSRPQGQGCKFWRCQLGYMPVYDALQAEIWECFAKNPVVNTSVDWVVGSATSTYNFEMHYCWFPPRTKGTFTDAHVDTVQLWVSGVGEHRDIVVANSVLFASSNASYQATGLSGSVTFRDSWFG